MSCIVVDFTKELTDDDIGDFCRINNLKDPRMIDRHMTFTFVRGDTNSKDIKTLRERFKMCKKYSHAYEANVLTIVAETNNLTLYVTDDTIEKLNSMHIKFKEITTPMNRSYLVVEVSVKDFYGKYSSVGQIKDNLKLVGIKEFWFDIEREIISCV